MGEVASATTITGGLPRVAELFEATRPHAAALLAPCPGTAIVAGGDAGTAILLRPEDAVVGCGDVVRLPVAVGSVPIVAAGERVVAGQALTDGPCDPRELLAFSGRAAAEEYLVGEIAGLYRAQGVGLDRRHVELVVTDLAGG